MKFKNTIDIDEDYKWLPKTLFCQKQRVHIIESAESYAKILNDVSLLLDVLHRRL